MPAPRNQSRVSAEALARFGAVTAVVAAHALAIAWIAAAAAGCGRLVLARLPFRGRLERLVVETSLGLGLFGSLLFALALFGALRAVFVGAVLAILPLGLLRARASRDGSRDELDPSILALGCIASALVGTIALYPPTGFDATLYHLPNARDFARAGTLMFDPTLRFPVFPQLAETWFAAALLVADDRTAQLVEVLCAVLTAAFLLCWSGAAPQRAGRAFAAATFAGSPLGVYLASAGYVEAGVALFVTATAWSIERWRALREDDYLLLAGVFAGLAAATKYTGAAYAAIVLASALAPARERPRARGLALAAAAAILVALPWYVRSQRITGNPVFPFLPRIFGAHPWEIGVEPLSPAVAGKTPGEIVVAILDFALLPIRWVLASTLARDRMNSLPPLSYVALLTGPASAVVALVDRSARRLLGVFLVSCWVVALLGMPASAHYLLALAPLLALLSAIAVERVATALAPSSGHASRLVRLAAAVALLPGCLYAAKLIVRNGPLPADAAAREQYLAAKLPGSSALAYLNGVRPHGYVVYGLLAENLRYHADGTFLGDFIGPASYRTIVPLLGQPELLARRLRGLGVEYLLVPRIAERAGLRRDRSFERRFRLVFADRDVRLFELADAARPLAN